MTCNMAYFATITHRPESFTRIIQKKLETYKASVKVYFYDFFLSKNEVLNFFKNTQNCFAYISATKYRSETILYSKQTARYLLHMS